MLKISTLVVVCVAAVSTAALADDTKMGDLSPSRGLSALAAGGNTDSRPQLSVNPRSGLDGELGATKGAASATGLKANTGSGTDTSLKLGSKLPTGPDDRLSTFSAGGGDANSFSNASSSASLASLAAEIPPMPTIAFGPGSDEAGSQLKSLKASTPAPTQLLRR
jgi:hypothetical protein